MASNKKSKKSTGKKLSHPDLEAKKSLNANKPERVSKGQVRLSVDEKGRQSVVSNRSSRKSSVAENGGKNEPEVKTDEVVQREIHQEFEESEAQPLDPEKSKEKAKVLKQFLENKYKVEFPKVEGTLEKEEDITRPLPDKEVLARNGLDMDMSKEEQMHLLNIYEKLEEGLEQAEEFFRSIGIEWSSEHQMFKVKPKKFMPAMTMIAFGPDYDDVIVCKDNEETGETQACVLSKDNKECPQDVTAVNLNVYKDGFQAEDDDFYAYSSDSIRDFFQKNIGSYIIMKPNDNMPQTILIKVIDERERSFDEVEKERAQGIPRQPKKPKKKSKSKTKDRPRRSETTENSSVAEEEENGKSKYYAPANSRVAAETVEIFERHKIIKRIEDVPIEDDGMGPSSWCWKNQRNPLSSEYVVPPNITTTTFDSEFSENVPFQEQTAQVDQVERSSQQRRQSTSIEPPIKDAGTSKVEKSTSVTSSFLNIEKRSKLEKFPRSSFNANQEAITPVKDLAISKSNQPVKVEQEHNEPHSSETKINKINIYHGPVTVINLGDASNDSVQVSPKPDNKLKVSMRRQVKQKPDVIKEEEESLISYDEWNNTVKQEDHHLKDWHENVATSREIPEPPWGNSDEPMTYETEYDSAYNQGAAKWSQYFADASKRKSADGGKGGATNAQFEHISMLGQAPPPGQEPKPRIEKKISVLLDMGGNTGRRETGEVIVLNKKTSDTQITVALRDNVNGKKYMVNIYPEEQLKKIWSILQTNKIDIQKVTPELVLGASEWQGVRGQTSPATSPKKEPESMQLPDVGKKEELASVDLPSLVNVESKMTHEKASLSKLSKITEVSEEKEPVSESEKSDDVSVETGKPPSIQSDAS